ncbi:peptide-methionine (S)-S-oxide reductase MsrA [Corynebacterium dentalis]|uniref:peptide-methionine (S)-S-oxide reductase MsrA n=1 Tax=Corynebacterium dentalis TaxID=2014528 RepID=UPI000C084A4C|nr:peptide-methionine (S)-S-oxide reductase MsrA [Corynebacterium dentalis]
MASFLERIAALNSSGPYRAERVTAETALKGGRHPVLEHPQPNPVLGTSLGGVEDFPAGADEIVVGMGCFWGAERMYWDVDGVLGTSVGYAGGFTKNPTYREVCTGRTGHTEAVRVVFDPEQVSVEELLKVMFENHDPTLGDRQGNDVGTQYRSAVYASSSEQLERVRAALQAWSANFAEAGFGELTTEVGLLSEVGDGRYYLAEDEHQQYLHKNPAGYCNHGPNGVTCQTGVL